MDGLLYQMGLQQDVAFLELPLVQLHDNRMAANCVSFVSDLKEHTNIDRSPLINQWSPIYTLYS